MTERAMFFPDLLYMIADAVEAAGHEQLARDLRDCHILGTGGVVEDRAARLLSDHIRAQANVLMALHRAARRFLQEADDGHVSIAADHDLRAALSASRATQVATSQHDQKPLAPTPGASAASPEGWRLVPVEPTEAMLDAGRYDGPVVLVPREVGEPWSRCLLAGEVLSIYRAMLAAAPNQPNQTPCDHSGWSFAKHGRGCPKCGQIIADFGD